MSHYFTNGTRSPRGDAEHLSPPGGARRIRLTCTHCRGTGKVLVLAERAEDPTPPTFKPCWPCNGTGTVLVER